MSDCARCVAAGIAATGRAFAHFAGVTGVFLLSCLLLLNPCQLSAQTADTAAQASSVAAGTNIADLGRIQRLIKAGVLDLAQRLLEMHGPRALPTAQWIAWEKQLWTLYEVRENWPALRERIARIPPSFPREIRQQADRLYVRALIAEGKGSQARAILRRQLSNSAIGDVEKRALRREIVESYLADNQIEDAATAMSKFQSDYRSQEESWLHLSARTYLQLKDYATAINLLAPISQPGSQLLAIFARLQNRSITPAQAQAKLHDLRVLEADSTAPIDISSVQVFASRQQSDPMHFQMALEGYLSLAHMDGKIRKPSAGYPAYFAEDLLAGYRATARFNANQTGLLDGDDARWLDHAMSLPPQELPVKRAFYGYLLARANAAGGDRSYLGDLFVSTLIESGQTGLTNAMFGEDKPFGMLLLGPETGLALGNHALQSGDVKLAGTVMGDISVVPAGMDKQQWQLQVARVLIIAGRYERGSDVLRELIQSARELNPEFADQVLQPVFDLQTVGQHSKALELLHLIRQKTPGARHRREIAYWIAESCAATRQHILAADYFIFSAIQKDEGFDQWGESAYYRAAESLQAANLVADARTIYERLLARATDPSRTEQLQQKLQELRLLESSLQPQPDTHSAENRL